MADAERGEKRLVPVSRDEIMGKRAILTRCPNVLFPSLASFQYPFHACGYPPGVLKVPERLAGPNRATRYECRTPGHKHPRARPG